MVGDQGCVKEEGWEMVYERGCVREGTGREVRVRGGE